MLDWTALGLVALVNFSAAFVQASAGFGYALVAMALMPLFLPMQICSAISATTIVFIGIQMSLTLRKHLQIKTILLPVLSCLCTINLGLWILDSYNEMVLRIILACLLLGVTILFFIMRYYKITLPNCWYSAVIAGLVTGLSTGMFNIVGPFLLIYFLSICTDTLHVKASLEFSFLIAGLYSTAMHTFVYHNITMDVMPALVSSVVAALIAGVVGLKVYRKIDRDKLALTIYILLPIMAGTLIWNGLKL